VTNSADAPGDAAGNGAGSRRGWMIAIVAIAVVVVAGVVLAITSSSDSSDDDSATVDSASANTEVTDSTDAPDTTAGPGTTEAPASTDAPVDSDLEFMVNDIDDGGTIPENFTCDGADDVPIVSVTAVPEGTQQLALIMDDADAPTPDPFVHWVVYGIAGDTIEISDGNEAFMYGQNDFGGEGWQGPCPPPGGPHTYTFTLYALDAELILPEGLDGRELAIAIELAILVEAEISATYERE